MPGGDYNYQALYFMINLIIRRNLEGKSKANDKGMTNLWSSSSNCPSTMLDPPTDLSTKIENSVLSSFMKIPRLI